MLPRVRWSWLQQECNHEDNQTNYPPGLCRLLAGLKVEVVAGLETELGDADEAVTEPVIEEAGCQEEAASVDTTIMLVSTGVAVVSSEVALGVVCVSDCVSLTVVVTGTRPPVSGETA